MIRIPPGLTHAEAEVWRKTQTGDLADLRTGDSELDRPERAHEWTTKRTVRAEVLVRLLMAASDAATSHRKGVRLQGARITGHLDLEGASLRCRLALLDSFFEEVLVLQEAIAVSVRLSGSHLPGLRARQLETRGDLRLDAGFTVIGEARLEGAHVGGDLDCRGGTFVMNEHGACLTADGLTLDGNLFCAEGFEAKGEVRLVGARIRGHLICAGGTFVNQNGRALNAQVLSVEGEMFCHRGFAARGEVRLVGARIRGQLFCGGGSFINENGPALDAQGLTVKGGMFCDRGFMATGEVRLVSARIHEQLSCRGGTFINENGPALDGQGLTVDGGMFCDRGFMATGEVRLVSARIHEQLSCRGGTFINENGPALDGQGLTVDGGVFCDDKFAATGEVRLVGSHISDQLSCRGGTFTNEGGPALNAEALTVVDMFCDDKFAARGGVLLAGSHISGHLSCDGGTFAHETGYAIDLERASVTSLSMLPGAMSGSMNLTNAQVGVYVDDPATWPPNIGLDGFEYASISSISATLRLKWLARNQSGFSPQPYEQLAAAYRRAGRDDDVRRVAIEKQRRRRAQVRRRNVPSKAWHILLDWTVGYGYRTSRAGLWLIGLLVAGSLMFSTAHDRHQLTPVHKGDEQPPFQPIIYTLDVILPVVNLHQRDAWIAQGGTQWVAVTLTMAGWVLTTAVVLSLTGLLRRE